MGINGLLPLLKSIQKPAHIKQWKGQTVAIDAYGWLHRGTIACAIDLALGKHTRKYVDYAMHRVRMLKHYGVIPFLVFDGDYLPGKKGTEIEREKKRSLAKDSGLEHLRLGRTTQAHLELQKAIDVTPLMARYLIEELKKEDVQYIVAPYEADAQMAFLERSGIVSAILSEDSDLLVFGAQCLLTKLEQYGECIAIERKDFHQICEVNLTGWSHDEFRRMAILSGCDYLPNIPKMGIKTAYRYVRKYKSIEKIVRALQLSGSFTVPTAYEKAFLSAELTFQYQSVYDPIQQKLVFCNGEAELPSGIDIDAIETFGRIYDADMAMQVATGDVDPMTKLKIELVCVAESRQHRVKTTPKIAITNFFAPRTPLGELPSVPACQNSSLKRAFGSMVPNGSSPATSKAHNQSLSKNVLQEQELTKPSNKRVRLCMDDMDSSDHGGEESRFFETKPSASAPSRRHTATLQSKFIAKNFALSRNQGLSAEKLAHGVVPPSKRLSSVHNREIDSTRKVIPHQHRKTLSPNGIYQSSQSQKSFLSKFSFTSIASRSESAGSSTRTAKPAEVLADKENIPIES